MKRVKIAAFLILAFILPLIFSGSGSLKVQPKPFAQITVIVLSLTLIAATISKIPLSVRLFYVWCIVSTFTSRMPQTSAICLMAITLILLMFRSMLNSDMEKVEGFYKIFAVIACVQVFWIFVQAMNRDFLMNLTRQVHFVFGTMGNKNVLGGIFLFLIPFMYMFKRWTVLLPVVGILYSEASAAIFALVGGIAFYIFFINFQGHSRQRFSQKFMKFVVICGLIGAVFPAWNYIDNPFNGFTKGRWPIWKKTMELMFEREEGTPEPILLEVPRDEALKTLTKRLQGLQDKIDDLRKHKLEGYSAKVDKLIERKDSIKQEIKIIARQLSYEEYIESKGKAAWDMIAIAKIRYPWLGYGLGTFAKDFPRRLSCEESGGHITDKAGKPLTDAFGDYIPIQWPRAHSMYLQFGRDAGLIGMFFLLLIPGIAFAKFIRAPKKDSIVIFASGIFMICLNGIGSFPERNYSLMYYILLTLSVFYKEVSNVEKLGVDRVSSFIARRYSDWIQGIAREIGLCRKGQCFSFQR